MSLRSFLLKRFVYTLVLIFFVIIVNWLIFTALPGLTSGLYNLISNPKRLDDKSYYHLVSLYGLNQPYWVRFLDYVRNMLTFQFGFSYSDGQDITSELLTSGRLANTLVLLGSSTAISIVLGILLGIISAHRRGSMLDTVSVTSSLTTYSLPTFWLGTIFILIFAIGLGWFPPGNVVPFEWSIPGRTPDLLVQFLVRMQHLFLPALTLTLFSYGQFVLLTRATMMEALTEDYILTAKAKGLSQRVILLRHAFKNASLPIITASALSFGGILGGAIITETIFNWAGLGKWLYDAVIGNDFPVMQAMFYIIALCVIAANFISDIIYGIVDPRVKYE